MERFAKLGETKRIRRCAGEHKINITIGVENLPNALADRRCPFILPVRWRVIRIRLLQSCPGLRANRGRVITGKLVTNRVGAHPDFLTWVLSPGNKGKRLP